MLLRTTWIQEASRQPLAFAQVREDPRIDLELLETLGESLNVVLVASGGCTGAAIAASGRSRTLRLVDMNPSQIALSKLKLFLLENEGPTGRMELLGHVFLPKETRAKRVNAHLGKLELPLDVFGDPAAWSEHGLDHCGRYELLFAELRRQFVGKLFGRDSAFVFARVMSLENLQTLFGKDATSNRATEFWRHFHDQTEAALTRYSSAANPFLAQMLDGRFAQVRYDWLDRRAPVRWPRVMWHNQSMLSLLSRLESASQDFVHLSNILDWLQPEDAQRTIAEAGRVLRPGGLVVLRQLNSKRSLRDREHELEWLESLSSALLAKDRSFFYRNIHVGRKVS